jgi:hypothetical protein
MVKLFLLLISQFVLINSYGQLTTIPGKPRLLTKIEEEIDERNKNCFYQNKYTAEERLQFYPFNKAAEIKLVAFDKAESLIMGGKLPMKKGSVDYSRLKEIKAITKNQIDSLTDILFNRVYGGPFYSFSKSKCYSPRNAILFVDVDGKTFAFIEICFQCTGYRLSSKKIKGVDFCNQKYDYLNAFFATNRIKFGVTEEIPSGL